MKRWVRIGLVCLLISGAAQMACADIPTISVTPVTTSVTLARNEKRSGIYRVHNNSDKPLHVSVEPRYWFMLEDNKDIPLERWLEISPREFDLEPMGEREVEYRVSAPEGMKGELSAMIAFRPKPEEEQPVNIVFSVSLYVVLLGTERVECDIADFKLWKHEERDAVGAIVGLENSGNVHLKPMITVFVQDLFNKTLQKADLKFGDPVYPGERKIYEGAIYNFRLRPGLYKAVVDMDYTNIARKSEKKIYFLVGPGGKIIYTFFRRPK